MQMNEKSCYSLKPLLLFIACLSHKIKEKIGGSTGNHLEARFIENPNHPYMSVSESHLRLSQQQASLHLRTHPSVDADGSDEYVTDKGVNYQRRAKHIDETSRVLFPVAFTLFVIVYWIYYLYV